MLKLILPVLALMVAIPVAAGPADKGASDDVFKAMGVGAGKSIAGLHKPSGSLIGHVRITQDAYLSGIDANRSRFEADSVSITNSAIAGITVDQDAHLYGVTMSDSTLDVNRLSISNSTIGGATVTQDANMNNVVLRGSTMAVNRIDVR